METVSTGKETVSTDNAAALYAQHAHHGAALTAVSLPDGFNPHGNLTHPKHVLTRNKFGNRSVRPCCSARRPHFQAPNPKCIQPSHPSQDGHCLFFFSACSCCCTCSVLSPPTGPLLSRVSAASPRLYCMVPFYWDNAKTRHHHYETIMMTW